MHGITTHRLPTWTTTTTSEIFCAAVLDQWQSGVGVFRKVSCSLEFSKWLQQDAQKGRLWLLSSKAMGQITLLRLLRGFWWGNEDQHGNENVSRLVKLNQTMELASCSINSSSPRGGNKKITCRRTTHSNAGIQTTTCGLNKSPVLVCT